MNISCCHPQKLYQREYVTHSEVGTRIINGASTSKARYPYFSSVWIGCRNDQTGDFDMSYCTGYCGGTLVASDVVMTAAHCLYDVDVNLLAIIVGWHDDAKIQYRRQMRRGVELAIHDGFTSKLLQRPYPKVGNDIALIRLDRDAPAESVPISLNVREVPAGSKGRIIGHGDTMAGDPNDASISSTGASEVLLGGYENIIADCSRYPPVFADTLCGGGTDQSTCAGDSGGPILLEGVDDGVDIQIGIASFGESSCRTGMKMNRPSTKYTDVAYHHKWISDVLGRWGHGTDQSQPVLPTWISNQGQDGSTSDVSPHEGMILHRSSSVIACPRASCDNPSTISNDSDVENCLLPGFKITQGKTLEKGQWIRRDESHVYYFGLSNSGSVHVVEQKGDDDQCHVLWTATAAGEDMSDANNWHEGNFLQMVNGNIVLFGEGGSDNEVVWSAGCSNNGSILKMTRLNLSKDRVLMIDNRRSNRRIDFWIDSDGTSFNRC